MSAGDARHGRRDNGLVAAEYAPAGDVDPRVGEHLLDVLALDGIAAYLRPSTDLHPVTRQNFLPARPTDRLYVDRQHLATARDYLARLAEEGDQVSPDPVAAADPGAVAQADQPTRRPGPDNSLAEPDFDQAWAEIVAGYHAADAAPHTWPAVEDMPEGGTGGQRDRAEPSEDRTGPTVASTSAGRHPTAPPERDEPSLLDGLDTFGANLPDEENEGYTPPAPPPVPRPSLPTVLGVAGIVGGLVVFLKPSLLPMAENTSMILGFIAIVAGFATLVWRLRPGDDDEDPDPDFGAKV